MNCGQEYSLSKCDNVILEAKRVLLTEDLDRIANRALSENIFISSSEALDKVSCDNVVNIDISYETNLDIDQESRLSLEIICIEEIRKSKDKPEDDQEINKPSSNELLKKYFRKWRKGNKKRQEKKINKFINTLKHQQQALLSNTEPKRSKSCKAPKPTESFRNRYKVQNQIIDRQKEKIEEQNRTIDELKLGIIREDLLKSIENNKNIVREIFGNCSEKILCRAPLIKDVDEREKFMVSARKAPKLIQRLQQRAIERNKYREEILRRKHIKEEERQNFLREIIESKKALEEEERKRNLELINEQRKQELRLQKIREQKRQEFEKKVLTAVNFYNNLLVRQCFKKLYNVYTKSKENNTLARATYVRKVKFKTFKAWLGRVEAKYAAKNNIADAYFNFRILRLSMARWKEFKLECVRSLQVAEDLYDFRLMSNTFIYWHRYICKELMIQYKKEKIATKHNNRRLLFQYFHQWRYLPTVIQLEKSKEETKRKWREKVWEILPDYRPPETL